ncbi:MAG: hypothetical protein R6U26_02145 [Candidatus Undinarchaeales archaeon]
MSISSSKGKMDKDFGMPEEDVLTKFSYNGGILMFDIYYEHDIDPRELITKIRNSIEKTTSEKLLPGISKLLDEMENADKWSDFKRSAHSKEELEEIANFEQVSDYYLRFVAYNCLKILKKRDKVGKYLEELKKQMKKYFPEEVLINMNSTLNAIKKLIEIAPKEATKKQLTKKLKEVTSFKI